MFDIKRNGVIEFGEFVRSLSIFHPRASEDKKIECMKLTLYQRNQTLICFYKLLIFPCSCI
jgi:serine/threonine-protein phosphatase 2B regulatory subunit